MKFLTHWSCTQWDLNQDLTHQMCQLTRGQWQYEIPHTLVHYIESPMATMERIRRIIRGFNQLNGLTVRQYEETDMK